MVHHKKHVIFPGRLAPRETLGLHEILAFKTAKLTQSKAGQRDIEDPELQQLSLLGIELLERHMQEIMWALQNQQSSPLQKPKHTGTLTESDQMAAADSLSNAKSAIRSFATTITETATPYIREMLIHQLFTTIRYHEQVFNFMYMKGLYPAYDLDQLITLDFNNASKALQIPIDRYR
jgi:spore coat protein F